MGAEVEGATNARMRAERDLADVSVHWFCVWRTGDPILVRMRDGEEFDRLELTDSFRGADVDLGGTDILQRWEPDRAIDFEASQGDDSSRWSLGDPW